MKLFIQLRWFFRQQWRRYLLAISLLITVALLQLLPPHIIGLCVDLIVSKQQTLTALLGWCALLIVIALLIYLLRYCWRMLLFGASYQLAIALRTRIYQKLSSQSAYFYRHHRTGDLMARVTNDVDRIVFAAGEGILTIVDSLVMGCAVLVVMSVQISWQLTLLSLLPMPIMACITHRYGEQLHAHFRTAQEAFSTLNDYVQDNLTNIRVIKGFGLEAYQAKRFRQLTDDVSEKNNKVAQIDAKFNPTIYLAVALANMLAVGGGGWLVIHQRLSLGELTSFIMYLGLMIWPMLAFAWMFNIIERGRAAYHRVDTLLQQQSEVIDGDLAVPDTPGTLRVDIQQFQYPDSTTPTLEKIQFQLAPGQQLGICGITGAGKSTLLALIQRQFTLTDGDIFYHDRPLTDYYLDSWRARMAVVNQNAFLFSMTIAENIALGKPNANQNEIERVAQLACIHDDILRLPQGYQTQVGERGVLLSGGQKQRIAIARALLLDAEIVVLDDALSAVDGHTEYHILTNLQRTMQQKSVIICAHRLSALVNSDQIIVLKHGQISQQGRHAELIEQPGWYQNMYRYQQLEASFNE